MNNYLNDLRKKDTTELQKLLKEARIKSADEVLKLKLGKSSVENKGKVKKEVAQIMTVLKEKEILNG